MSLRWGCQPGMEGRAPSWRGVPSRAHTFGFVASHGQQQTEQGQDQGGAVGHGGARRIRVTLMTWGLGVCTPSY